LLVRAFFFALALPPSVMPLLPTPIRGVGGRSCCGRVRWTALLANGRSWRWPQGALPVSGTPWRSGPPKPDPHL
jgi:hypothetical protein